MLRYSLVIIISLNCIYPYFKQDPIMIGLSGAYSTVAKGYQSVGINPANLAFSNGISINMLNMNLNLSNNFLTRSRMQGINGADLDNPSSEKYFSKDDILNYLNGEKIIFSSKSNFYLPFINFSKDKFAINSQIKVFSELQLSQDIFKMLLYGNIVGETYDLSMTNKNIVILESSFTKAFDLSPVGIGFTIKYLKGLCYYDLKPIKNSFILTDTTQIQSQARYILEQNIYGNGLSFDLGISTKENEKGWKFGLSFINLFGELKWNKKSVFDESLSSFDDIFPYDDNESYLINLSIDNLSINVLNDLDLDSIYELDAELVYEVQSPPSGTEGDDYFCSSEDCETYYILADGVNLNQLDIVESKVLKQDYPTSMFIGVSKRFNGSNLLIFDLSTGLDGAFGNIEKWRFSTGYIFQKKRIPLRIGLSYGGYDKKSFSFGSGLHFSKLHFDFGISFKGNLNIYKTNGIDFGMNMSWINI